MSKRADAAVQGWFDELPFKLRRELAETVRDEAEGLRDAIAAAAPKDEGDLADSVEVRRKRNTLEFEVTVGGPKTTRSYDRSTDYASEVVIDGRSNEGIQKRAKGEGAGVSYDYAMGVEFGNEHAPAQPFAYPTFRAREAGIQQRIADKVEDVLEKA